MVAGESSEGAGHQARGGVGAGAGVGAVFFARAGFFSAFASGAFFASAVARPLATGSVFLVRAAAGFLAGFLGALASVLGVSTAALSAFFVFLSFAVLSNTATEPAAMRPEKRLFAFSVVYLFALFGALVVDRFASPLLGW